MGRLLGWLMENAPMGAFLVMSTWFLKGYPRKSAHLFLNWYLFELYFSQFQLKWYEWKIFNNTLDKDNMLSQIFFNRMVRGHYIYTQILLSTLILLNYIPDYMFLSCSFKLYYTFIYTCSKCYRIILLRTRTQIALSKDLLTVDHWRMFFLSIRSK